MMFCVSCARGEATIIPKKGITAKVAMLNTASGLTARQRTTTPLCGRLRGDDALLIALFDTLVVECRKNRFLKEMLCFDV